MKVFTSTDLNRRSREVFDCARDQPVTISRNNERFALLRREEVATLIQATAQMAEAIEVVRGALALRKADEPPPTVAWMKSFDEGDRFDMLAEILTACSQADAAGDWEPVGDVIHEWQESAAVIRSGALKAARRKPSDE